MGRICDICNYDLGEQTEFNFERHRNSNQCKANQRKKSEVSGRQKKKKNAYTHKL